MTDTLPPTSAELEAVAIFEALVAEFGEWKARLANLESLLPEEKTDEPNSQSQV